MANQNRHLLALSAQIVSAHAAHNQIEMNALPNIIRNVYNTLADLKLLRDGNGAAESHAHFHDDHDGHTHGAHNQSGDSNVYVHPAYGQTVFSDHLICMEDGLSMKMLKRHLLTVHNMTPEDYRAKWGLPDDYPMVAADYAKLRSSLALQSGLGLKPDDRPNKSRKGRTS
jgi:predicted transcriptional regulator